MDTTHFNRRKFLKALAATNCLAAIGWGSAGYAANDALKTQAITKNLSLITGAGGNVVFYNGTEGVTLIDTGAKEHAAELLKVVDELSGKTTIRTVFNTNWKDNHTGGNEAVHARGAKIIAHENTKLWLGAEYDVEWRNWHHQPRAKAAMPDITFYTNDTLDLGGETVEYGNLGQAYTDGDLYVYFPTSNVLAVGGLLSNKKYPSTDIATGGWIGGLIKANEAMLAMVNDTTVIIPGQGPTLTKADLQAQHDMLADIYEQMKELARQGLTAEAMLKEKVTAKYDAAWGSPEEFVMETYRGMALHTYDMGGFI